MSKQTTTIETGVLPVVKNSLNAHLFPKKYKTVLGASLTIPDQSLTMREILTRYTRGMSLDGQREGLYEEEGMESNGINYKVLDLADLQRVRINNEKLMNELKTKLNEEKAQNAEKRAQRDKESKRVLFEQLKNEFQNQKTEKNP